MSVDIPDIYNLDKFNTQHQHNILRVHINDIGDIIIYNNNMIVETYKQTDEIIFNINSIWKYIFIFRKHNVENVEKIFGHRITDEKKLFLVSFKSKKILKTYIQSYILVYR